MSNTRTIPAQPVVPQGDMGLGLCLGCLGAVAVGESAVPQFAVTLAPMLWPPGRADGVPVAVPACWEHVRQQVAAGSRRPLLVPK